MIRSHRKTKKRFDPKLVIITGASRGIGAAISELLLTQGYTVILLARREADLLSLAKNSRKRGGKAHALSCDVSKLDSVEETFSKIQMNFGTPGILINNAGLGGPFHRTDEVSPEEWRMIFATNLDSVFYTTRLLLPQMKANKFGRIVNISSIQGFMGGVRSSTYAATKHAMIGYTKSIAAEWGTFGITCNAICPGFIDTSPKKSRSILEKKHPLVNQIPAGRLGLPREIAASVSHFISAQGAYINGASLVIDGGLTSYVGLPL